MTEEKQILEDVNLAFEQGLGVRGSPKDLWRVFSIRMLGNRQITHIDWFGTLAKAREHADWIENGRGEVISVSHYQLCSDSE